MSGNGKRYNEDFKEIILELYHIGGFHIVFGK